MHLIAMDIVSYQISVKLHRIDSLTDNVSSSHSIHQPTELVSNHLLLHPSGTALAGMEYKPHAFCMLWVVVLHLIAIGIVSSQLAHKSQDRTVKNHQKQPACS